MKAWLMLTLSCVLLLAALSVTDTPARSSTQVAPVQVEVLTRNRAYSYDCWPAGEKSRITPQPDESGVEMMVYLSYPAGLAGYRCEFAGRAVVSLYRPGTRPRWPMEGGSD